jgi:hypothetical protein
MKRIMLMLVIAFLLFEGCTANTQSITSKTSLTPEGNISESSSPQVSPVETDSSAPSPSVLTNPSSLTPSPIDNNTEDTANEIDSALEAYKNVLENKAEFYSTEDKKNINLDDLYNKADDRYTFKVTHFTILDLDNDKVPEVILELSIYHPDNFEILHFINGTVYGYNIPFRGLELLKSDGTFWIFGDAGYKCETLRFNSTTYESDILAYSESSYNKDIITVSYFIDNKSVTEDDFLSFLYEQKEKPNANWYEFSQVNIDTEFDNAKITF